MQSFISRMNRINGFANLSKRCFGVMTLPVISGEPLPLMATSTVLSTPDVDQPVPGTDRSQAKRAIFRTRLGREFAANARLVVPGGRTAALIACLSVGEPGRYREWIQAYASQAAEQFCGLAGRLGLNLNPGKGNRQLSLQHLPVNSRHQRS